MGPKTQNPKLKTCRSSVKQLITLYQCFKSQTGALYKTHLNYA